MNIILLPGNSILNKDWIYEMANLFKNLDKDSNLIVHEYKHWKHNSKQAFDIKYELNTLDNLLDSNNLYYVFAKSAGTMLTMILNQIKPRIRIEKAVFVGTPIGFINDQGQDVNLLLKGFNKETLFIQNEYDPYTSYLELAKVIGSAQRHEHFKIQKLDGKDHEYADTKLLVNLAMNHFNLP